MINSKEEWNGQDIICQQAVDERIALDLVEEVWLNGQKAFKKAEEVAFYDIEPLDPNTAPRYMKYIPIWT